MSYDPDDASTYSGALRLSRKIEGYWLKRGRIVRTRLDKIWESDRRHMYCVRSNLTGRE